MSEGGARMGRTVRCDFCAFGCLLRDGQVGACGVRRNTGGPIVTLGRDRVVAAGIDPIEKKPFYHFLPGTRAYSVALAGCNFRCAFCQNYTISQREFFDPTRGTALSPLEAAENAFVDAASYRGGVPVVAYTYSEPAVWQDYMIEAANAVRERGGLNVMVSNGFLSPEARGRLLPLIDGFSIDVKGDAEFYLHTCRGRVEPVLDTIEAIAADRGAVLEVTTLAIEGLHTIDGIAEIGRLLAERGVQVWHISRFHPAYRMANRPATSEGFLRRVLDRVRSDVDIPFIYPGNSTATADTVCPSCGSVAIRRRGYAVDRRIDGDGRCRGCGAPIYGLHTTER